MREDMDRVITERPRRGARYKAPKGEKRRQQKLDLEDQPRGEKIRRKWLEGWSSHKEFTDVIGPLRGYILSKVGCQWDDVYSEICSVLPAGKGGMSVEHARGHIFDFVTRNVEIHDGIPYDAVNRRFGFLNGHKVRTETYVHPVTGELMKTPDDKQPTYRRKKKVLAGPTPDTRYVRIKGIWYIVYLAEIPDYKRRPNYNHYHSVGYDLVLKCNVEVHYYENFYHMRGDRWKRYVVPNELREIYGGNYYAYKKRQLNHREIEKANLRELAVKHNLIDVR